MAGLRKRLAAQRARKRDADRKRKRFKGLIATRLAFLAQRPRLAVFLAREFNLRFTSGWRSVRRNRQVGGVANSWHTKGTLAKPGASDLVGSEENMAAAMAWARKHVPGLAEALIHDVGSGRHLHLGGWGVANWTHPDGGRLKRWRAGRDRQTKRSRDAAREIAKVKAQIAAPKRRARKEAIAREHGAHYVDIIFDNCERLNLPKALGLAMCEQETGFENEYGHDQDRRGNIIWHGQRGRVLVTESNYRAYKAWRNAHGLAQGVGPMQLTSPGYQDRADKRGGCWKPEVNIAVGLEILAGHIKSLGRHKGIGAYNGGAGRPNLAYADSVEALERRWAGRLT